MFAQVRIWNVQLGLSSIIRAAITAIGVDDFVLAMISFFGGKQLRQILVTAQWVTGIDGSAPEAAARTCAGVVVRSSGHLQCLNLMRLY